MNQTEVNSVNALSIEQRQAVMEHAPDLAELQARIGASFVTGGDVKGLSAQHDARAFEVAKHLGFLPMSPIVLLDQAEEGYCEDRGWVEAIITEDEARDALAEFCSDEDGGTPWCPDCGPATRVWLKPQDEHAEYWGPCELRDPDGIEFWQVPVS